MNFPVVEPTSSVKDLRDIGVDTINFLANTFGKDWQMFATKYNFALKDYLNKKLQNIATFKLLITANVVSLENVYVQQYLQFNDKEYHQNQIYKILEEKKKIVISAQAGTGKSCLLKSWVIEIIRQKKPYLPIFYELKALNNNTSSILDGIFNDIKIFNSKFNEENLKFILNDEKTILFLDAFDEITHIDKIKFQQEINTISAIYPSLKIVISSRPEKEVFDTWSKFTVIDIVDININQAKNIVNKIGYDKNTVNRFVESLEDSLFETHNDFAKNPLLLTIMLMTYEQFSDVPTKMHIFYEQAFQVLFNRHDSFKDGFKRPRLTNLDIKQFSKVFSLFSLVSYCKEQFRFTEKEVNELLSKCIDNCNFDNISANNLKTELIQHVPLLMKDGLDICFVHRSFQEYFTALYLTENSNINPKVLNIVIERFQQDKVLAMAYEINPRLIDKIFLPVINAFLDKAALLAENNLIRPNIEYLKLIYSYIFMSNNTMFAISNQYMRILVFLSNKYSQLENDLFEEMLIKSHGVHNTNLFGNDVINVFDREYNDEQTDFIENLFKEVNIQKIINIATVVRDRILKSQEKNNTSIEHLIFD